MAKISKIRQKINDFGKKMVKIPYFRPISATFLLLMIVFIIGQLVDTVATIFVLEQIENYSSVSGQEYNPIVRWLVADSYWPFIFAKFISTFGLCYYFLERWRTKMAKAIMGAAALLHFGLICWHIGVFSFNLGYNGIRFLEFMFF